MEKLGEIFTVVECVNIRTDWFGRKFIFTKDPDGQPIELIEGKMEERDELFICSSTSR